MALASPFIVIVAIGAVSSIRRALCARQQRAAFRRECEQRRAAAGAVH
ncbi:MAG TPA: hypothetical protein VJN18_32430 [Polyangiaceae bacterium]|nr:hypothetical protein [Polyangiaceae bacterium]